MVTEELDEGVCRVSVVIPTLGFNSYLKQAVESLGDLCAQRAEVILVVDGERQDLPDWVTETHPCRTYFTGVRSGSASAINLGVHHSLSEYIARLDADDISRPSRLAKQLEFLDRNSDIALVGSAADLVDDRGQRIGAFTVRQDGDPRSLLLRSNPFVHSSLMLRREAFNAIGGYDESCIRMQDYDLLLRLALGNNLRILPEVLVDYRVHAAQTSKSLHGFTRLMIKLSRRKIALASTLGRSRSVQLLYDVAYSVGQGLRYIGVRKPRYLGKLAHDPRVGGD